MKLHKQSTPRPLQNRSLASFAALLALFPVFLQLELLQVQ